MNDFLDTVGALLYIFFNVVIFPLIALVNCIIWTVLAIRYLKLYLLNMSKRRRKALEKRQGYDMPVGLELAYRKLRLR